MWRGSGLFVCAANRRSSLRCRALDRVSHCTISPSLAVTWINAQIRTTYWASVTTVLHQSNFSTSAICQHQGTCTDTSREMITQFNRPSELQRHISIPQVTPLRRELQILFPVPRQRGWRAFSWQYCTAEFATRAVYTRGIQRKFRRYVRNLSRSSNEIFSVPRSRRTTQSVDSGHIFRRWRSTVAGTLVLSNWTWCQMC